MGCAGGAHDHVACGQGRDQVAPAQTATIEATRQLIGARFRAVDKGERGHAVLVQRLGRQYGHLPGAHDQHMQLAQVVHVSGDQVYGRMADRGAVRADRGLRTGALATMHGLGKEM